MFTSITKQIISVLLTLQAITFVAAQSPSALTINDGNAVWNVSTKADDYILENRRQYNATLQDFLDKINDLSKSFEDQLKVLDKQKNLLLDTLRETNEKLDPLEVLSLPTKYCVQKYKSELPYGNIVKANIERCFTTARNSLSSITSKPTVYYTNLNNYYNGVFKNDLTSCAKSYINPSLNYTLCITSVISKANTNTINYRKSFATAMQSSTCSLNGQIDDTLSCTYNYYNSALESIGAVTRLIDNCINGYLENKPAEPCINNNNTTVISAGCPNVTYLEFKDGDFKNATVRNLLQRSSKNEGCLEIRFNQEA